MPGCTSQWKVYLLLCSDGSVYCGVTTDVKRRLSEHNSGRGAKYTRSRRPCTLVACWLVEDRSRALRVEARLKSLPRRVKIDIIGGGDILVLAGLEPKHGVVVRVPDCDLLAGKDVLSSPDLDR